MTAIESDVNVLRNLEHKKRTVEEMADEGIDSDLSRSSTSSEQSFVSPVKEEEKLDGDEPGFVYPAVAAVCSESPSHVSFGSSFPTVIYQLRSLQLISIIVQLCVMYMESDRMGLTVALPSAIHILNFYHTGKRLYQNIDGRFDIEQIFGVSSYLLKTRYCYEVLASIIFSALALFTVGDIPSTISSVIYSISKVTTFGASLIVLLAEIYEVIMLKLGQRPHLLSKKL